MGVYKRNGIWYVRYRSPVTGKVVRKSTGVANKKLALAIDAENVAKIAKKQFLGIVEPEDVLFDNLCDRFIRFIEKRRQPETVRRNRNSIKNLKKLFSGKFVLVITPQDIEKFVDMRLEQGVSFRTVNIDLTTLHFMYTKAIEWNCAVRNPVDQIRKLKVDPRPMEILTIEDERRLMDECAEYTKPIVQMALYTGMRKGEVLDLKWSEVKWETKMIRVRGTKVHKTRFVPINGTLLQFLTSLGPKTGDKYIFAKEDGKRYGDVKKGFKAACRRAGIPNFRFHDLRDTFATRFIVAGGRLVALKMILGHSDIRVTMRYIYLSETCLMEDMKKMDKSTNKAHIVSQETVELAKC